MILILCITDIYSSCQLADDDWHDHHYCNIQRCKFNYHRCDGPQAVRHPVLFISSPHTLPRNILAVKKRVQSLKLYSLLKHFVKFYQRAQSLGTCSFVENGLNHSLPFAMPPYFKPRLMLFRPLNSGMRTEFVLFLIL